MALEQKYEYVEALVLLLRDDATADPHATMDEAMDAVRAAILAAHVEACREWAGDKQGVSRLCGDKDALCSQAQEIQALGREPAKEG